MLIVMLRRVSDVSVSVAELAVIQRLLGEGLLYVDFKALLHDQPLETRENFQQMIYIIQNRLSSILRVLLFLTVCYYCVLLLCVSYR